MSYNSKYTGAQVEELLDSIGSLAKVAKSGKYDDLTNLPLVESSEKPTSGESLWVNPEEDNDIIDIYNRSQIDSLLKDIYKKGEVDALLKNMYMKEDVNTLLEGKENRYGAESLNSNTIELSDTKMYMLSTRSELTITLPVGSESNGREYMCQFTASESGCTLSLPSSVIWLGGAAPTINAGKTYQLSILNNLAVMGEF